MDKPPLPNRRPLPMRPSRRDLEGFQPGAVWDLTPYLPWLKDQTERRGLQTLLFVLTATHCDGCRTLKTQLKDHWDALEPRSLVVLAEAGDLYGACFFAIRLGTVEIRAPGLPTAYVLSVQEDHLRFVASSMGPLDESDISQTLRKLLDGESRVCRDARGSSLNLRSDGQEVSLLTITQRDIPIQNQIK